jgi:beta-barrel assembly-enhancing protease
VQYVDLSPDEEIVLGLQAAPEVAQQYGGLYPDDEAQALVKEVGQRIVQASAAGRTPYQFDFHLLADTETVNAFALPGGPIFITAALLARLETEGQLAGVLGHEIAHVVARHGAERLAKQKLTQGLVGAAGVATDLQGAQLAAVVGQLVNMRYSRQDELESDRLGVRFMTEAGYDPNALKDVMQILEQASGGSSQPEFMSTHPNPGNRIAEIEAAIAQEFPNGLPGNLIP